MVFNSLTFILFFCTVLLLYYSFFQNSQNFVLLLASVIFYCFSGPKYIIYILVSTLTTYFCAYFISDIYTALENSSALPSAELKQQKEQAKKKALRILRLDLLIVLGILVVLKYFNFFSKSVFDMLGIFHIEKDPVFLNLVMPLGLSYFTFMNIGYILDVYWKKIPAEKEFLKFSLFTLYFPHVVQGPISRYGQLAPQFLEKKKFDYDKVCSGLQLALWGFFKKMVIADRLGIFVSQVYDHYQNYYGVIFIVATVLYSIQIYADFSGCMDIVCGVSETFGITLEKNFNHPYFSRTIPEFWRRWHITLGTWFKDYVFYPVSRTKLCKDFNKWTRKRFGNQVSRTWSSVIPLLCVWLLTGLWHGAAWKYVAWGLFHGGLIIGGTIFAKQLSRITAALHIRTEQFSWHLFQILRTFTLCCIGRVFFRAGGGQVALDIFRRTFSDFQPWVLFDGSLYTYGLDRPNFILAMITIVLLFAIDALQERFRLRQAFARQNIVFRWIILYAAIFSVLIFGIYGPGYDASQFIYNNF